MTVLRQGVGVSAIVLLTYWISRYTTIVQQVEDAFANYGGSCPHEHSLYDVEESQNRLRIRRRAYVGLVILVYAVCFSH